MSVQPPYLPKTAGIGGRPTIGTDIPVLAIFLLLYIVGAAANMIIYQLNRRKGHKFLMSWAMFGFCMARVATCVLRIVWANRPTNSHVAIAAQILLNAGVLVAYIVVLILSQRVLRATQPRLGWNKLLAKMLTVLYILLFCAFVLVISFTVLSFYTLNLHLRSIALWIQRVSILYILVFNIISLVMQLLSLLLPPSPERENFGTGSMKLKQIILGAALFFCLFIAGFRAGTAWAALRPASDPAWYDSKAAFYVIDFSFEIVIIYLLLITRFDRMFWVPNSSRQPGDYSQVNDFNDNSGDEPKLSAEAKLKTGSFKRNELS